MVNPMALASTPRGRDERPTVEDFYIPPTWFDDEGDDGTPERLKVTFSGSALRRLVRGARILGVPYGEFVRIAVKQTVYLAERQLEGYELVLRDSHGSAHPVPGASRI
jgi:hypothetical protein